MGEIVRQLRKRVDHFSTWDESVTAEWMMKAADRIEALEAVVRECGAQFRYYEANHRAKPDLAKAETNAEFARKCEALLP